MQDRPDAAELAAAIAEFLRTELLPATADARLQFRLRVAINGLGMLEREARLGSALVSQEAQLLASHLEEPDPVGDLRGHQLRLNAQLAAALRRGEERPGTLALLQRLSADKLAVSSPAYLQRHESKDTR